MNLPLLALLLACDRGGLLQTDQPPDLPDTTPAITALSWDCDVESAEWTVEILADAWSAGAYVYVAAPAVPGQPVVWERHSALSVEAARDGSSDRLLAEVGIVADWREAGSGSTRFPCSAATETAWQVDVYDRAGDELTACLRWGLDGVFEEIEEVPGCDALWTPPADTGAADTGAADTGAADTGD